MSKGRIRRNEPQSAGIIPVIGKLKIGEKVKKGTKEYPVSLDYFKADGKYAALFHSEEHGYGEKPSVIQVAFVSDDIKHVCDERFEMRDAGGRLYGTGDGELFSIWDEKLEGYADFYASEHEGLMDRVAKKTGKPWQAVITLRFLIPEIKGVIGVWQLSSKGAASSIPAIRQSFDYVMELAGTVIGVPFDLSVEKVKSQKPGAKSVFPVLSLIPNISTGHLETVRRFLEAGEDMRRGGLLTEARLDAMTPKQLEAPAEKEPLMIYYEDEEADNSDLEPDFFNR